MVFDDWDVIDNRVDFLSAVIDIAKKAAVIGLVEAVSSMRLMEVATELKAATEFYVAFATPADHTTEKLAELMEPKGSPAKKRPLESF